MLARFQKSVGTLSTRCLACSNLVQDAMIPLMSRVEDIAHQKMNSDKKLAYMPQEAVHRELMDEMDRYDLISSFKLHPMN
jgi:hypothetical protein